MSSKTPYCPPELVEHLRKIFPDRCPSMAELDEPHKVAYRAGEAGVVRYLAKLVENQIADSFGTGNVLQ